jgi:hypothetical protein
MVAIKYFKDIREIKMIARDFEGIIHELKTWPTLFQDMVEGKKKFEVRNNDRRFYMGDRLKLMEFDPFRDKHTGRWLLVEVTYIIHFTGIPGLDGFVGMGFEVIEESAGCYWAYKMVKVK